MIRSPKTRTLMLALLSIILLSLIFLVITLFLISPGRLKPFVDQNGKPVDGSISEKVFVKIGGVMQGMFIRGRDLKNPVMLFVHGGPSFPEYFLVDKYPSGIEDHFTVCYWEERGGGLSYTPQVTLESMTLEQLASDAIEVTNYLRNRFSKAKIYIMAHSGGTTFGIQAVASFPQLYAAYIGMAQITNQAESEKIAYKYMLNQYSSDGNSKMVAEFKKYPILDNDSLILPFFNSILRDKSMHDLGIGTMHNMRSILKDIFMPVWTCRAYTIKEKFDIWASKFSFINKSHLREQLINSNIPHIVHKLDLPVYFLSGRYDLTVNIDLAKDYLKDIESPIKGFYTFNKSAHSPMFEEPQRLKEILILDILNGTTNLVDN
jgi:pimeloyl-ACP methyl ester carboxylesterase